MRRYKLVITVLLACLSMSVQAQDMEEAWGQVAIARQKDLPQTAIEHLQQIEEQAARSNAYGELLKATLLHARLQTEVSPDSLRPAVDRLEQRAKATTDVALRAVYDAVLSVIYSSNHMLDEKWETIAARYRQQAMAHPDVLAQTKAGIYKPFVVEKSDSHVFGGDLLSVIGAELGVWQWLSECYSRQGNRLAACLSAVNYAKTVEQCDSLIALYGDLPEACELAVIRYDAMRAPQFTTAQRYEWLKQSLERWGSWRRSDMLRNRLSDLTNPTYQASAGQEVTEPMKPQTVKLSQMRSLESLTMRVFRTTLDGDTQLRPYNTEDLEKIRKDMRELPDMQRTLTFSGRAEHELFDDSLQLAGLQPGVYLLEFSSQPSTSVSRSLYFVSGVRLLSQPLPENRIRYVVVDATTGQPLAGAKVRVAYNMGWNQPKDTKTLTCDKQGECTLEGNVPDEAYAYTAADRYCPQQNGYGRYSYYEYKYNAEHTNLFTDRAIYRPGQTVHVTAILWREVSALQNEAVAERQVNIELHDTNYKLVAEQRVVTDRFGKCSADLTLPTGLLNGRFTIRAANGTKTIRVEEYKRPTFQVEFADYEAPYQQGDTVHVQGKAVTYSGVPVQGARVKYTVRRRVAWWWMAYSDYWGAGVVGKSAETDVLNEGEAVTGDDGTFVADMPMLLPKGLRHSMYYHIVVEADVTDVAGETHNGTMELPLGTKSTALACYLPQQLRADELPEVTFSRRNAAGNEIAGTVRYRLDGGRWKECAANVPCDILNAQLKSGSHRLEAVCEGDSLERQFVVFSLSDRRPATTTHDWFYVSHREFPADGKPVTIQVGASDPAVHIVYSIYSKNRVVEAGAVERNGELLNRQLTYKDEYEDGLLLTFAWVKDGTCHTHQCAIKRPMPDKRLTVQWETFRDRLTPGQQEEWRLKITPPAATGGKQAAEQDARVDATLMAVLYDKSLDAITPHRWSFAPYTIVHQPSTAWQWTTWGSISCSGAKRYKQLKVPYAYEYSHFDQSVYPEYFSGYRFRNVRLLESRAATVDGVMPVPMVANEPVMAKAKVNEEVVASTMDVRSEEQDDSADADEAGAGEVKVRENLDETAFFYPAMEADKDGTVTLRFTLPESLTTWRFMGIAHTPDMLYGSITGESVAKKDVMVQPNVPRFIRTGDEAQVSARIINSSERTVSGQARLLLIDPATEQTVYEQSVPFTVEAGKTGQATFQIQPAAFRTSLLVCKVVAAGEGFSDGEQHYLPILPNSEFVTRTVPYTQHEPGVKTIDLTGLFPAGTTQQKLTVEYTNNPAWLMVQSLSTLGQPYELSAIDQAASYYSNLLAKTLIRQNPVVKTVFEQWKREAGQETSLMSALQKNQELKDIVLAETPWVDDADREAEQKQRLAGFFDENGINNRLERAVEQLKKLQNRDGSFSWYPGMDGSIVITEAVEEMLTRLAVMTGEQSDTKSLRKKARDFVDHEMVELVKEMKKAEKKGIRPVFPSFTALRWMYICAIDNKTMKGDVKAANDYLLKLLKKEIKHQTIYEKALTAIILNKNKDTKKAAEYVKSLKEYTVYTEEMGRYYDTRRASYSWYDYKIPTEVAAIEAIQAVTPDDKRTVEEMRRWLLQEKRTQAWDTPISSVNAIWAFMAGNGQQLATDRPATVLAVDGVALDVPAATAGIGYVKTAVSEPKGQTFTATKTSEGTSWGAVYAQFLQPMSDITASQSGITVKREVIAVNNQAPSSDGSLKLAVGDRIRIRITIETTRDIDFVQVADRRAACMEPIRQLSGYHQGAYCSPKDYATHYFYGGLAKGKHIIETEYYIDRAGSYETGTCTVGCAYSPEYRATAPSMMMEVTR